MMMLSQLQLAYTRGAVTTSSDAAVMFTFLRFVGDLIVPFSVVRDFIIYTDYNHVCRTSPSCLCVF